MKPKMKLQDIINELDGHSDDTHSFIHLKTGQVIFFTSEELQIAEEEVSLEELPEWQQEMVELAIDLLDHPEDYLELPGKDKVDEYRIMEDFCYSLANEKHKNSLIRAIQGWGAFRRFKDKIIDLGIADDWYRYRDEEYKEVAIKWCEEQGLDYE